MSESRPRTPHEVTEDFIRELDEAGLRRMMREVMEQSLEASLLAYQYARREA